MSNATVPQRTTRAQRQSNAVARAESLTVDYYLDGDTMIVASSSTPGKLYIVSATGCSCPAGVQELPCKHAAYRLQVLMPPRKPQTDADYARTLAACDELF